MHRSGVIHPDLHPNNLLLLGDPLQARLVLLDLHDVVIRPELSRKERQANLITLNRWFILRASRADRLRFWRSYCRHPTESGYSDSCDSDLECTQLEEHTWHSNLRFWLGRARRCLGNNRYFRRIRTKQVLGYAVRDLDNEALARLLSDSDAPFRGQPPILKNSRSSTVTEFLFPVRDSLRPVIFKRFRVTSRWDRLASWFRPTPCLRSWTNGHGLLDALLPTPRPLAVWHRQRYGISGEGYLLVEKVIDGCDLHQFLERCVSLAEPRRREAVQDQIEQLAHWVSELHRRGWSHRDLKATNILVPESASGANPSVNFIDLVGARRVRRLGVCRRQKDLARLNASFWNSPALSRTDRLRFLRIYLQWGLKGRGNWKSWWRRIAELTAEKQARNRRRGRLLA
jgi:hypothetical protein